MKVINPSPSHLYEKNNHSSGAAKILRVDYSHSLLREKFNALPQTF